MKYLLRLILPIYVVFLVASAFSEGQQAKKSNLPAGPDEIRLNIKIAKDVEERMPVDVDSIFGSKVGRVYCWSSVARSESDVDTIYHIWNYEGEQESRVPLEITSPTFRAFSFQTIRPEQTGEWTVYIIDKKNNVLGISKFEIVSNSDQKIVSKLP
jgi:hypothetical protein